MPVFDGKLRNSSIAASNPPADPPIPAIGQAKPFGFERAVRRADFAPFRFAFAFARDAFFFAVRFAAMAAFFIRVIPRVDHSSADWQVERDLRARWLWSGLPPDFKLRLRRGLAPASENSIHLGHVGGTRPPGALALGASLPPGF